MANPRQRGQAIEHAPAPALAAAVRVRQRAQELIDGQVVAVEVVRRGQLRHHLAIEAPRPQPHAPGLDVDEQIGHRQRAIRRRAADPEVRDLVGAQHRTQQDVAHSTLGEVHDLGEHRAGSLGLLGRQVGGCDRFDLRPEVTEAPQQVSPRATVDGVEPHEEVAGGERLEGGRRDRAHHREGRRFVARRPLRQRRDVGVVEHQLAQAGAEQLEHARRQVLGALPPAAMIDRRRRGREPQPVEQRLRRGAPGPEADAGLLVEHLDQRHPRRLVACDERVAEPLHSSRSACGPSRRNTATPRSSSRSTGAPSVSASPGLARSTWNSRGSSTVTGPRASPAATSR